MSSDSNLHLIGYHIGDIWASPDWNQSRWEQIYEVIRARQPDLIVLHEVPEAATAFFNQFSIHGYQNFGHKGPGTATIFYLRLRSGLERRFRIELPPVLTSHPLIEPSSLTQLRFSYEGQSFDLYGITLAPASRDDLNQSIATLIAELDPKIPTLISVSVGDWHAAVKPPAPLVDVGCSLGWTSTVRSTRGELRANQIWVRGFKPIIATPLGDEIYHGLSVKLRLGDSKKLSRSQSWTEVPPPKFLCVSSSLIEDRAARRRSGCILL